MRPKKIVIITPPESLSEEEFSPEDSQMIIELKREIYSMLVSPKKIYFLAPVNNQYVRFGWELVKNCKDFRYEGYYGDGNRIVYDLCDAAVRVNANASFVVVPMMLFNEVCRQIHSVCLKEWNEYAYAPWELAEGAVGIFDWEAKESRVALLGCIE